MPGTGLLEDLSLTLNIENVFNEEPPVSCGGNQIAGQRGVSNGNTLGRLIQFGRFFPKDIRW